MPAADQCCVPVSQVAVLLARLRQSRVQLGSQSANLLCSHSHTVPLYTTLCHEYSSSILTSMYINIHNIRIFSLLKAHIINEN